MMSTFNKETNIWSGNSIAYETPLDTYFGEIILQGFKETPDRVIQICHDEGAIETTCAEMRIQSIRVAQNLKSTGVIAEDVVGIVCRNSVHLKSLVYGCILYGCPINPLNASIHISDIVAMFKQTEPKLVFCDNNVYDDVKAALLELKNDAPVYTVLEKVDGVRFAEDLMNPTGTEEEYIPPKFENDASKKLLAILCSSGTTGSAKGVCVPHTTNSIILTKLFKLQNPFRSLCFSPIFWATGFYSTVLSPLRAMETRIVTRQAFTVELFVHLIEKYKVNIIFTAPTELSLLMNSELAKTADLSSIKVFVVTGTIIYEPVRQKFKEIFPNAHFLIAYAMSELTVTSMMPGNTIEGMTVGPILPNVQLKIVDENGKALPIGERGEICVKSAFKFCGYYKNPEATKNALDEDDFIKTGDVGFTDETGSLHMIDRIKDIFKYKGRHVSSYCDT